MTAGLPGQAFRRGSTLESSRVRPGPGATRARAAQATSRAAADQGQRGCSHENSLRRRAAGGGLRASRRARRRTRGSPTPAFGPRHTRCLRRRIMSPAGQSGRYPGTLPGHRLRHRGQAAWPARAALQRTEPAARLDEPRAIPPAADAGAARRADGAADACAAVAGAEVMRGDGRRQNLMAVPTAHPPSACTTDKAPPQPCPAAIHAGCPALSSPPASAAGSMR